MIFSPASYDDLSQFLQSRDKAPLRICGANGERTDCDVLSMGKLNLVRFYEPEEMIICAQAGILLADLEKTLHAKKQWIPTLAANVSRATTLGSAVSLDSFHPRSLSCGALRTTILGGTFCTSDGQIFKSGSRVVKSVAGYDIHRAFCGSRGLFGVILDLTLKVQPMPEMFYRFLAPTGSRLRLLEFHPTVMEQHEDFFLVELAGYEEDITADITAIKSYGIPIYEVDQNKWDEIASIVVAAKTETVAERSESEWLLKKVRGVFDPGGVLT